MKTSQKFITTFVTLATLTMLGCGNSSSKPVAPTKPTETLTNPPTDSPTNVPTEVSTNLPTEVSTNVVTDGLSNTSINPIVEIPTPIILTHNIINSEALLEKFDPVFNEYCSAVFKLDSEVKLDVSGENYVKIAKGSRHLAIGANFRDHETELLITLEGRIEKAYAKNEDLEINCNIGFGSIIYAKEVAIREIKIFESEGVPGLQCSISKGTKVDRGPGECTNENCNFVVTSTQCGINNVKIKQYDIAKLIPRPANSSRGRSAYGACYNKGLPGEIPPSCIDNYDFNSRDLFKSLCNPEYSKWLIRCPSVGIVGGCLTKASNANTSNIVISTTVKWYYGLVEGSDPKESCKSENSQWVNDRTVADVLMEVQ